MKTIKPVVTFLLLVLILLITALPSWARDDAMLSQIAQANDHYSKNQFDEAVSIYQGLVDRGFKNGYLYYNLANTYSRLGKPGPSILNYIRAKKLLPRDESLATNLEYAIQKTQDQLEPHATAGLSSLFFWTEYFNENEHFLFLLTINLFFWIVLAISTVRKTEFWSLTRKTLMAILIVAVLSLGVKITTDAESQSAVVMARQIEVKSAQDEETVTLFQLHEGAVVAIIARENEWVQIELNDGKKGWTLDKFIGV